MTKHDESTLPKWAQSVINNERATSERLREEIRNLQRTLPWAEPGMSWFTVFHPNVSAQRRESFYLFTCNEHGTHAVCSIGPTDTVFIGRGAKPQEPPPARVPVTEGGTIDDTHVVADEGR